MFHDELSEQHSDPLVRLLRRTIKPCIKILSVLMVLVILWGVVDVICHLIAPPIGLLDVGDICTVFGAFMVVLIAIEIFTNKDKALIYQNVNGNLAISKDVLTKFKKLTHGDEVVWSRSGRQWRFRQKYDRSGRMQD